MKTMKTSYFGNLSNIDTNIYTPLCIAVMPPKGIEMDVITELAPNKYLVKGYLAGQVSQQTYKKEYLKKLEKLDIKKVIKKIKKLSKGKIPVLLCYEDRYKFCHRKLIYDIFLENDIILNEL